VQIPARFDAPRATVDRATQTGGANTSDASDRPITDLDILARPGGSSGVAVKKVLLAMLACAEAKRLGIAPEEPEVQALTETFWHELGLEDPVAAQDWLAQSGLTTEEFEASMADFAAVLVVEAHFKEQLAGAVQRHRRLMAAREHRMDELAGNL
jgi:hypothetical protein